MKKLDDYLKKADIKYFVGTVIEDEKREPDFMSDDIMIKDGEKKGIF